MDRHVSEAVLETLESGWWSMGPRVEEFEQRFAELCDVDHAVAVANGTAALHLALLAVGCGPGDEVVLPSLTFVAAANVVLHTGARPVFCDVCGEHDLNLEPADVRDALTAATKAVVTLHYGGHPCDMTAVNEFARDAGVAVIEDAAHAPGASLDGKAAGALGSLGCFSFFSNKNLPVGEGGMVVTADDELAAKLRRLRSHGMTTLTWDRHRGHAHEYDVLVHGFNARLDELRATIGLAHLGRLRTWNAERAQLVGRYRERLADLDGLTVPFLSDRAGAVSAHHLMAVVLEPGIARDDVRVSLRAEGIQTSVHYPPIHRFTAFRDLSDRHLPVTDDLAGRLLTLPLFPTLGLDRVDAVCDVLETALARLAPATGSRRDLRRGPARRRAYSPAAIGDS